MRRAQEAVRTLLSAPVTTDLAQHKRIGCDDPVKQDSSCSLAAHIAKIADAKTLFILPHCLRSESRTVNQNPNPFRNPDYLSHRLLTAASFNGFHRIKSKDAIALKGGGLGWGSRSASGRPPPGSLRDIAD